MTYIVFLLAGAVASASVLIIGYYGYFRILRVEKQRVRDWNSRLKTGWADLERQSEAFTEKQSKSELDFIDRIEQQTKAFEEKRSRVEKKLANHVEQQNQELEARKQACQNEIAEQHYHLNKAIASFESHKIKYDDVVRENCGLKQDCFNLSVQLKKMERDHAAIAQRQDIIDGKTNGLASRYLKENVSWIGNKLNPNNFSSCKQRLLNVIGTCRSIGFDVPEAQEQGLVQDLQNDFEQAVRDEFNRQEQARIKAQIREEERLTREIDKQIKDAKREKAAIQSALKKAIKETKDEHSAEVEILKARLREAEEKAQRAISQSQLTKTGHVYVLSNIGSFGEGIYKIGMTRRLEPQDRVRELGDASVPFPFDVHMMISCDDAPTLENALHREFHKQRVNKVNFRKEFFRVDFETIQQIVELKHGEVEYHAEPEALQYRETMDMPDEDYAFIEHVVKSVVGDADDSLGDEE